MEQLKDVHKDLEKLTNELDELKAQYYKLQVEHRALQKMSYNCSLERDELREKHDILQTKHDKLKKKCDRFREENSLLKDIVRQQELSQFNPSDVTMPEY